MILCEVKRLLIIEYTKGQLIYNTKYILSNIYITIIVVNFTIIKCMEKI